MSFPQVQQGKFEKACQKVKRRQEVEKIKIFGRPKGQKIGERTKNSSHLWVEKCKLFEQKELKSKKLFLNWKIF